MLRKNPKSYVKIGGLVILNPTTVTVLVLLKDNGDWDLPKGHVEDGETFLEGAERECLEETGMHSGNVLELYPFHSVSIPSKKWLRFFLAVSDKQYKPKLSHEHVGFEWLSPREAAQRLRNRHGHALSKAVLTICTLAA